MIAKFTFPPKLHSIGAVEFIRNAIAMQAPPPNATNIQAALHEATIHYQAGRLPDAERICREILREFPDSPETNMSLAIALKDQGKLADAETSFRKVVALVPNAAATHNNLGNILFAQDKYEEAEACYRRALVIEPNMADAIKNLGLVIVDRGGATDSMPIFRRHAELAYSGAGLFAREQVLPHKVQHDQEQRAYVTGGNGAAAPAFNIEEGARMPGRALNPDPSNGEIARKWQNEQPQVAVLDNLLTEEALERMRQFCYRSTIWHKSYPNGYVGAMPEHGFACPLIAQIADELRDTYPAIIGNHPLLRWWAFKYTSQRKGINVHADFAAVNVNFWITPDDANLDPASGGLIIWDKPAPLEWSFAQYNNPNAGDTIRKFLADSGAKAITVPHRANRAVIFDSDLFHQTDAINFKEGYLNRRINITMLYGRREAAAA